MVGVDHKNAPLVVDIDAHTLTEYVPAKPLESNLEVVFGSAEQVSATIFVRVYLNNNVAGFTQSTI